MEEKKTGMSIRKKLLISYLIIVALIVVVGLIGLINIYEIYKNGNEIYVSNLKSVDYLKSISQNVREIDQCVVSMMSELDESFHQDYREKILALQQENEVLMAEYETLKVTGLEERRYNQTRLSILTFNKQIEGIVREIEEGDTGEAVLAYTQELLPVKACTYELIEAVVELSATNASNKSMENYTIYRSLIWVVVVTLILAVAAAVGITLRMSNYFTEKLSAIQKLAKRISEYNVSGDIKVLTNDEFGETMEVLNDSQLMMRDILAKIIEESTVLSETGEEVSLALRKVNQRIEEANVKVYNVETRAMDTEQLLQQTLEDRTLDDNLVDRLRDVIDKAAVSHKDLKEVQAELANIVMRLEQIGVTSDYQNEIANEHREQVNKFKVREE